MVQVRKLVLAIAAATALSSGMAQALELGELTLRSSANQPLNADIELLDVRDLTANDIKTSLAPAADFAKAGIARPGALDDLTFTPVLSINGRSVIRITSSKPVTEPMLKFLVQVNWPSGRQSRDYSLLLDPSKFSPEVAKAASQPIAPAATPAVSAPTPAKGPAQYTTTPRDTLWDIAQKVGRGASVQQTMLGIQALNPDAFIDGNINLIKTGQVLRLPDSQQSTALPQNQAIAEVARQNAAWREGRRLGPRAQQLDATRRGAGSAAPAEAEPSDKLSLVSGAGTKGKGRAGDAAKALNDKLAVTQESLDSTRRANDELKSRNADLQGQLDTLQKLLKLKSDQLARLEAASKGTPDAAAPSTSGASASTVPVVPVPVPVPVPAATAPASATAPISAQLTPSPASPATDATSVPAAAPVDKPLQNEAPAAAEPSSTDTLTSNPTLLYAVGGGALVVLLLLLLLLARRRKAQLESEKHMRMARALAEEAEYTHEDLEMPESSFDGIEKAAPNVHLSAAAIAASASAAAAADAAAHQPTTFAPPPPQTVIPTPALKPSAELPADVLPEVEQLITLGRFNRAAELLEAALERTPERSDLRLKLMEVYGRQGDRDGFIGQERQLVATGDNYAHVEALKNRFPAMVAVAAVAATAAAVAAEMDARYVQDLLKDEPGAADPLDTFDSDFDLSLEEFATEDEKSLKPSDFDNDLDFGSMLAEQKAPAEEPEIEAEKHDLSEFDLADIEEPPVKAHPADTDDFQLPDDFDLALAEEPEPVIQPPKADHASVTAELDKLSESLGRPPVAEPFAASKGGADDFDEEADFDFLAGTDESATKLDLARAYIEMGDHDGARDILDEVAKEGNAAQKTEANEMISKLA